MADGHYRGAIVLFVFGPMLFLIQPLVIGAIAEAYGLGPRQIGFFASSDLYGSALGAMIAGLWVMRARPMTVIALGLGVFILGNLITLLTPSFPILLGVRGLCGFGAGTVTALATLALGRHPRPDFIFGIGITAQLSVSTLALVLLPVPIAAFGFAAAYWFLIAVALLALIAGIGMRPLEAITPKGENDAAEGGSGKVVKVGVLLSCLLIFVAVSAVWAYSQPIAKASGIALGPVGVALAAAGVAGALGSLLASKLGERLPRLPQLLVGIVGLAGSALVLMPGLSLAAFVLAVCVFKLAYCFIISLQMAIMADIDRDGRFLTILPSFQILGSAIGPSAVAAIMTGGDLTTVAAVACTALLLTLMTIAPAARGADRRRTAISSPVPA